MIFSDSALSNEIEIMSYLIIDLTLKGLSKKVYFLAKALSRKDNIKNKANSTY